MLPVTRNCHRGFLPIATGLARHLRWRSCFRCQGCRASASTPSGSGILYSNGSPAGCHAVERRCLQTSVLMPPLINISELLCQHCCYPTLTIYQWLGIGMVMVGTCPNVGGPCTQDLWGSNLLRDPCTFA